MKGLIAWFAIIVKGILGGVLLGALYAIVYERVPTANNIIKGIIWWIVLWVLFAVPPLAILAAGAEAYAVSFVLCVIQGALTGVFWIKFGK